MAKCNCCGREMLTANGCSYKRVVVKGAHKETFKRIKVGDPGDWYEEFVGTPEEKDIRCGDAKVSTYQRRARSHHPSRVLRESAFVQKSMLQRHSRGGYFLV